MGGDFWSTLGITRKSLIRWSHFSGPNNSRSAWRILIGLVLFCSQRKYEEIDGSGFLIRSVDRSGIADQWFFDHSGPNNSARDWWILVGHSSLWSSLNSAEIDGSGFLRSAITWSVIDHDQLWSRSSDIYFWRSRWVESKFKIWDRSVEKIRR